MITQNKMAAFIIIIPLVISCRTCEFTVPEEELPTGWALMPSNEMPPSDKWPWWTTNPIILSGDRTKDVFINKFDSTRAVEIKAVTYQQKNTGLGVVITVFTYCDEQTAYSEFKDVSKNINSKNLKVSISRKHSNEMVFIGYDEGVNPDDKIVFERKFSELTK